MTGTRHRLGFGIFFAMAVVDCASESTAQIGPGNDGAVSIIVEPSDSGAALIAAIHGATVSVHATLYMLTDKAIIAALIARCAAGIEVRVVLNQNFPGGTYNANAAAYHALLAATPPVTVVWAPTSFTYTHEKCVVIDSAVAWVMTMNASASSLRSNREYLAVDSIVGDVAEAEAQFAADFAGAAYTPQGALLMSPNTMRAGLNTLMAHAEHTLDFEVEEISDGAMTHEFCNAVERGVRVRGAISDAARSRAQALSLLELKNCGVRVVAVSKPYIHAKALVADGAHAYIGSANYTLVSLDQNRELGVVTSDATAVAVVAQTVASDIAAGAAVQ